MNNTETEPKPLNKDETLAKYRLDEIDKALLQHKVNYPAITNREMAIVLNLNESTVAARVRKPKFKAALDKFFQEPMDTIREAATRAAREYVKLMDDTSDKRLRERVLRTILISNGILRSRVDESGHDGEPLTVEYEDGGGWVSGTRKAMLAAVSKEKK